MPCAATRLAPCSQQQLETAFPIGNPPLDQVGLKIDFLGKSNEEILMRKSRFTDARIMGVLRQVEGGMALDDVCHELQISSATF